MQTTHQWQTLEQRLPRLMPFIQFGLRLFFGSAVFFLNLAFELRAISVDLVELVVGELAPLLLDLALKLLPVAFDRSLVHFHYPCLLREDLPRLLFRF